MPVLKQVDRSATVAFCPHAGLMGLATAAGGIDMSFNTNSVLEIFKLDFNQPGDAPTLAGAIAAPERFNRLAWGKRLSDASPHTLGLLAGGLGDGSVCIWDPALVLDKGKNPLLTRLTKHTGAVKGLEFNPFAPNLLASGASDGELCIWDVANPAQPSLYPALKAGGPGQAAAAEITYLAWNHKVQQILASSTATGATVVWDLKKQRPVISFKDPNSHRRCSVLQWNPEIATQLIVASDDDRSPTLQMWDLRNSVSPMKEFVGHTAGVLGMAWCPHDPSLLLSSAKDNRTICWDVHSADVVCELPTSSNWNFDVQWCPTSPGVFSTASYDGKVGLYNLLACTGANTVETVNADFTTSRITTGEATPLKKAPAWMKRPVGGTFGFGGKLVSFVNQRQQTTDPAGQARAVDTAVLTIKQVVTEQTLVGRSEEFEHAIHGGDKDALAQFCSAKVKQSEGPESETWAFMALLFEEDARRQLLAKLGFGEFLAPAARDGAGAQSSLDAAANSLATAVDHLGMSNGKPPAVQVPGASPKGGGADFFSNQDDPDFFDSLGDQNAAHALDAVSPPAAGVDGVASVPDAAESNHLETGAELEEEIQRYLFVGNYEAAVEACFKANRTADALLLANIGGADLFRRAMSKYMQRSPRPYMQVVSAMVDNDYMRLVKTRPVASWKETIAVLATYTGTDQWMPLCDALADRLAHASMHHAASLCYICSGNVDQAVAYWNKAFAGAGANDNESLQSIIEKSVVMGLATNNRKPSAALAALVTRYAGLLAAQGRMATALEYLDIVPGESVEVAVLKDRIFRSGAEGIPQHIGPPPFPFELEQVRAEPLQQQQQQQQQASTPYGYGQTGYAAAGYAPAANAYTQSYAAPQQPLAYAPAPQTPMYGQQQQQQPAYGAQAAAAQQPAPYAPAVQQQQQQPTYQPVQSAYAPQPAAQPTYATPVQQPAYAPAPAAQQYQQSTGSGGGYGGYQQPAPPAYSSPAEPIYQPRRASQNVPPGPAPPQQQPGPQPGVFMPQQAAGPMAGGSGGGASPHAPGYYNPPQQQGPPPGVSTVPAPNFFVPAAAKHAPVVPPMQQQQPGMPGQMPPMQQQQQQQMQMQQQMQPGAPMQAPQAAPAPPPQPTGPPPNISLQTADTTKVPADQKPIVASLTNLFNGSAPLANNPAKKREMDDNSKRIGVLFWKLNRGEVSPHVVQKLLQMCGSMDRGDFATAAQIQVELTTSDWDECGSWLTALKRLLKTRQGM